MTLLLSSNLDRRTRFLHTSAAVKQANIRDRGISSCYDPRIIAAALVLAAVMIGAARAATGFEKGSAPRIALAIVQSLATAAVIVMPVWWLRRLDEMQQRIQLHALAIAFAGTGIIVTGYRWLEMAGLPKVDWGTFTWPLMALLWAAGFVYSNRRYS